MKTVLFFVFAAAAIAALIAIVEVTWTTISRPDVMADRFDDKKNSPFTRIYLFVAVLGFAAYSYFGFYGLLFWMPSSWGSADEDGYFTTWRSSISGLLAFVSLGVAALFERHAQLVKRERVLSANLAGFEHLRKNIDQLSVIAKELKQSPESLPVGIREADRYWLSEQALLLNGQIQSQIARAVGNEKAERKSTDDARAAVAAKVAQKDEQQRRRSLLAESLKAALPASAPSLVANVDAATVGTLTGQVVRACWTRLDRAFRIVSVPAGKEQEALIATDVSDALRTAPGILAPDGLQVVCNYRGFGHGGETEWLASLHGEPIDLLRALRFPASTEGACAAFFVAHILPQYGRFWHSLAEYDYELFLDDAGLLEWLQNSGFKHLHNDSLRLIGRHPGLRLERDKDCLRISALGAGPTTNLTDFSIDLVDASIADVRRTELLKSLVRVLY